MSIGSSARRQLDMYVKPSRGPMGTTGLLKGPARRGREIDRILDAKRYLAAVRHAVEMRAARQAHLARVKRATLAFLAIVAALIALALIAHYLPTP